MITLTGTVLLLCNHRNLIIVRCKFDETIVHRSCTDFLLGGEGALFDGRYISEPAAVRLRDDPTGPCSDDPNESDQSELSLTLLRTPIVHGGGKVSDKEGRGGHEYRGQAQQNFMEGDIL
eukprot:Em0001g2691a